MSKISKIISKLLIFVMLVQAIPVIILSNTYEDVKDGFSAMVEEIRQDNINSLEEKNITNYDIVDTTPYILKENYVNRTETSKEFTLSSGEVMVQNFLSPVHFFNGENYEEIDNSLVEKEGYLENKGNSFKVRFYEDKVYIQDKDSYISFKYSEDFVRKEYTSTISKTQNFDYTNKKLTSPVELELSSSDVIYESNDITFEYNLSSNILKENILIQDNLKEEYSFIIETNEEVVLEDNEIKSNTFCIPSPNIINGNNEQSFDIRYSLDKTQTGYEFKVILDNEYIQNAVYPITIDPIISSTQGYNKFRAVANDGSLSIGNPSEMGTHNSVKWRDYISFNIPQNNNYHISRMGLDYYIQNTSVQYPTWYFVNVVENTNVQSITYTNHPSTMYSAFYEYIDGNNIVHKTNWFTPSLIEYNTITLEFCSPESVQGYSLLYYKGSYPMSLIYTYTIISGIDDNCSYEEFKLEGSTSYVNTVTGKLTSIISIGELTTFDGNNLSNSLICNPDYDTILSSLNLSNTTCKNCKTMYEQYLKKDGDVYKYIDATGNLIIFYEDENGKYYETNRKYVVVESSATYMESGGTRYYFNSQTGLLERIEKSVYGNNEEIVINNSNGKISSVNYIKNNITIIRMDYTYDTNGNLSTIEGYIGQNLCKIYTLEYEDYTIDNVVTKLLTDIYINNNPYVNIAYSNGEVNYIFDRTKTGYLFEYITGTNKISRVVSVKGNTETNRWYDSTRFNYSPDEYLNTEVKYYNCGNHISTKYVSYNFQGKVNSEWEENSQGIYVKNNYMSQVVTTNVKFLKEQLSFESSTSNIVNTINSNSYYSGNLSSTGLPNGNNCYSYVFAFKVQGMNINLRVVVGSQEKLIQIYGKGQFYITLNVPYTSANYYIYNKGTYNVSVSRITYDVTDYSYREIQTQTNGSINVSMQKSYNTSGKKQEVYYDSTQRVDYVINSNTEDAYPVTSYYSYYEEQGSETDLVESVEEIKNSNIQSLTEYTYSNRKVITEKVTKGSLKTLKQYSYGTDYIQTTEDGIATKKVYSLLSGDTRLDEQITGNRKEKYTYNIYGDVVTYRIYSVSGNTDTLLYTQTNNYIDGIYIGSNYDGDSYTITYNDYGEITSYNGIETYTYNNSLYGNEALSSITYANNQTATYSYSAYTQVAYTNDTYKYYQDYQNRVYKESTNDILEYNYGNLDDDKQELTITGLSYDLSLEQNYNEYNGRLTNGFVKYYENNTLVNQLNKQVNYTDNKISSTSLGLSSSYYTYDSFDRVNNKQIKYNGSIVSNKNYGYETFYINSSSYTGSRIYYETDVLSGNYKYYYYDSYGRISYAYSSNGSESYSYDSMGRLTNEYINGSSRSYTYDSNNNLTSRTSNGVTTSFAIYYNKIYYYQENGNTYYFSYDALGNPTTYKIVQ